jgi:hypothetical protein
MIIAKYKINLITNIIITFRTLKINKIIISIIIAILIKRTKIKYILIKIKLIKLINNKTHKILNIIIITLIPH